MVVLQRSATKWKRLAVLVGAAVVLYAFVSEHGARAASTPSGVPAPILGRSETVLRVSGLVAVRRVHTSAFVRLTGARTVPDGSEVDATVGRVRVTVSTGQGSSTSTAGIYGGRFVIHQTLGSPAITHFVLSTPLSCAVTGQRRRDSPGLGLATAAARPRPRAPVRRKAAHKPTSRRIFVSETGGNFASDTPYIGAIGVGTAWQAADSCYSSIVRVTAGVVRVKDNLTGLVVTLTAGHSYRAHRAERAAYLPAPPGVYFGVTGQPVAAFTRQVGRRQAVYGVFTHWGERSRRYLAQAQASRARLLLHVSTSQGYGHPELITPGAIARGDGDDYLLMLGSALSQSAHPAYIALLPEMNQTNNAYSAFNADGSARDADHAPDAYKQAWRRSTLIIRGGRVAVINQELARLNMPPVRAPTSESLPTPQVAFLWAPQVSGTPDTPANAAAAYYPGSAYVDIVGTDFYSQFPNFGGLERLYAEYPSKPFGFNEWAMWRNRDPGFAAQFFAFIRTHTRVQLVVYNQGLKANGPFRLVHFPAAAAEIRRQLQLTAAVDYTPDWALP
jgi:hypothetical protein